VNEYKEEMDTIAEWLDEWCLVGAEHTETLTRLYASYSETMKEWNVRPLGRNNLRAELIKRGFAPDRKGSMRFLKGLCTKPHGWSPVLATEISNIISEESN
jgi:phage/plasmid-associated DNA primase